MIKHIKKFIGKGGYYKLDCNDSELYMLYYFLYDTGAETAANYLKDKERTYIINEMVDARWSSSNNAAVLVASCQLPDDLDKREFFILKFDNFKKMIEDWAALEKKRVPEIYFIMDSEGSITVRESLEEK